MKHKRKQSKMRAFISDLMKGKSEEEILDAEERFTAYLKLVRKIQQRKQSENEQNT